MDTIKEILLKRGFSEQDIDTNFQHYSGEWNITAITKEQVAAARYARELAPLFGQDSVAYKKWCATYIGRSFREFAGDNQPFTVAPSELDPHIARLCRAVNEIGVCTCMSCDGWHKANMYIADMALYMKDRYSVLWFWLITEYIFGEKWRNQNRSGGWHNIWEPFDYERTLCVDSPRDMMRCSYDIKNRAEAKAVFEKNNCYAIFLERHREAFLALRRLITDALMKKISCGELQDIEKMGFLELRRCMREVFLPAAQPLANAFASEFPEIISQNAAL